MELISKSEFDKLWELNPRVNTENDSYENTHNYLSILLSINIVTSDGTIADFDVIYKRYKLYCHIRNMANEGVEEKYRKKENQIVTIYEYLKKRMFMTEEKIPHNSRHFYFWGNMQEDEILSKFNSFDKLCQK